MKRLLLILILAIFSANFNKSFSWDSTSAKYMPLQVGNVWLYYFNYNVIGGSIGYEKCRIISIYQANGKSYYSVSITRTYIYQGIQCNARFLLNATAVRIDSLTGNLFNYGNCGSSQEMLLDSLNSRPGDTSYICPPSFQGNRVICSDTNNYVIFGQSRKSKGFRISVFEGYNLQRYAVDIGLVLYNHVQLMGLCSEILLGCYVNGSLYGDTVIHVGINQINSEIPDKFSLFQNYPNPFNPLTKIKFQVPKTGFVKLSVFDVMGREIQVLVNQQLSVGTYEADFDASNLPSGVYYYKLETEEFNETKKMVLVK
jgi:hypothetical protein